jgi:hypothetical protein
MKRLALYLWKDGRRNPMSREEGGQVDRTVRDGFLYRPDERSVLADKIIALRQKFSFFIQSINLGYEFLSSFGRHLVEAYDRGFEDSKVIIRFLTKS